MTKLTCCLQIAYCLLFCLIGETRIAALRTSPIDEFFGPSVPRTIGASEHQVALSKSQPLVIKIPRKLLRYENYSLMNGLPIYIANVGGKVDELIVEGKTDWETRGWPPMLTLFYEKSRKTKEYTELECRSSVAYLKLRFWLPDVDAALRRLAFFGYVEKFESSEEFKALTEKLLPVTFPGALAKIPRDKQLRLLKELGYNDDGLGVEEFKGKQYISFTATDPTSEFNSLQVNQSARVATVLKAIVLPAFNRVAPIITDTNEVYGIKIRARIFYRDFLSERNMHPRVEVLEIFAPYDLVEKFFNLDITNQKLVEGSVVLVDGNRIEVDLSKAAQI